jgi:hypothetical protein
MLLIEHGSDEPSPDKSASRHVDFREFPPFSQALATKIRSEGSKVLRRQKYSILPIFQFPYDAIIGEQEEANL